MERREGHPAQALRELALQTEKGLPAPPKGWGGWLGELALVKAGSLAVLGAVGPG